MPNNDMFGINVLFFWKEIIRLQKANIDVAYFYANFKVKKLSKLK